MYNLCLSLVILVFGTSIVVVPKESLRESIRETSRLTSSNRKIEKVELSISLSGNAAATGYFERGQSINIKCIFRNVSNSRQSVFLRQHDVYTRVMPYPSMIVAKVWDAKGGVLTKTEQTEDGWWSSYIFSSRGYNLQPGDVIALEPNQEIIRVIPLKAVLYGCTSLPEGLTEGNYTVQLRNRVENSDVFSNKLEIKIK